MKTFKDYIRENASQHPANEIDQEDPHWVQTFNLVNDEHMYDQTTKTKWKPSLEKLRTAYHKFKDPSTTEFEKDRLDLEASKHYDKLLDHWNEDLNKFDTGQPKVPLANVQLNGKPN
jgi:hypothetical protein